MYTNPIKNSLTTFILLILFSPTLLNAQSSQPYFTVNAHCVILNKNKTAGDLVKELDPQGEQSKKFQSIPIPAKFAKANIRPLLNSTTYVFSESKFFGSAKVSRIYCDYGEEDGEWSFGYVRDNRKIQQSFEDEVSLREAIDIFCDKPIDVHQLKALNTHNDQFISQNTLTPKEIKLLLNETLSSLKDHDEADIAPQSDTKGKDQKYVSSTIGANLGIPDDLVLDKSNTTVEFSIQFPKLNIKTALIKCPAQNGLMSFIVCKAEHGLFFYPLTEQYDRGSKFEQIINWFGDNYLVFGELSSQYGASHFFKVTKDGLEEINKVGFAFD